jgi:hypothetical protein
VKRKKAGKSAAKRAAKRVQPVRIEVCSIELTRGQAYALLSGASAALEAGLKPPEAMYGDLIAAAKKFREAFNFQEDEPY